MFGNGSSSGWRIYMGRMGGRKLVVGRTSHRCPSYLNRSVLVHPLQEDAGIDSSQELGVPSPFFHYLGSGIFLSGYLFFVLLCAIWRHRLAGKVLFFFLHLSIYLDQYPSCIVIIVSLPVLPSTETDRKVLSCAKVRS